MNHLGEGLKSDSLDCQGHPPCLSATQVVFRTRPSDTAQVEPTSLFTPYLYATPHTPENTHRPLSSIIRGRFKYKLNL